jgi:PBSX family phage terminase large subunit
MIIGVTRDSIQRNLVIDLCQLIGARIPGSKATEMNLFGRQVYFVGANDESSVRRIQGATLAIALVDEATEIPEAFWNMLLSRLSVPGAQLLATLNPSSPGHWLKKKFLDRENELNLKSWHFMLEDNPILTKEYVEGLKNEYSAPGNGMWYKRYILGEWAVAEGLVYDGFDEMNLYEDDYPQPNMWVAGVDYGTTNPTTCILAGLSPKQWPQIHIEKEYYYSSKKSGRQKSDAELADDIKEFIGWRPLEALYVDPSAASFKIELRNRGLPVVDALHDVMPGIRVTHKFITHKNLVIHKSCKHLLEELATYSYCPRAAAKGKDAPIKNHDHCCFIAGTMIATENGQRPIEDLVVGDAVLTRNGYKPLVATMTSESSDIWELKAGNNTVIATGDHPFWIDGKMVELKDSSGYHEVCSITGHPSWLTKKRLNSTEKSTIDIPNQKDCHTGRITKDSMGIYTEQCGNTIKEIFQKGITYITSMVTKITTKLKTWNVCRRRNTPNTIGKNESQSRTNVKFVRRNTNLSNHLRTDSVLTTADPSIEDKPDWMIKTELVNCVAKPLDAISIRMLNIAQKSVDQRQKEPQASLSTYENANIARNNSLRKINQNGFAITCAQTDLDLMQEKITRKRSPKRADAAIKSTKPERSVRSAIVQRNVDINSTTKKEKQLVKVYNITVEDEHQYFVNNILTFNSDALRYCVYSSYSEGEIDSVSDHLTLDQRRGLAYGESSLMDSLGGGGMF